MLNINFYTKKNIFCFGLLISLFILVEPVVFVFTSLHDLFRIGQTIVLLVVVFLSYKSYHIKYILYIFLFFITLLLLTIYHDGAIVKVITMFLPIFGLLFLLQYTLQIDSYLTLRTLNLYFSLIIYINFFCLIFFQDGILQVTTANTVVQYHFLGVTNQFGPYFLLGSIISVIFSTINIKGIYNAITLNLCIFITLIMVWSATSIFWISIYLILILFVNKMGKMKFLINWVIIFIAIFLSHYLIVILNIQNLFSFIITDLLEKDFTLSGRTVIWNKSILQIVDSIITGYGAIQDDRYITVGSAKFNAHNIFLQLLLQGGLLLFLIFLLILRSSLARIKKLKNSKLRSIILIGILVMFSMMITEVYPFIIIFLLLFLGYNSKLIFEDINIKVGNK